MSPEEILEESVKRQNRAIEFENSSENKLWLAEIKLLKYHKLLVECQRVLNYIPNHYFKEGVCLVKNTYELASKIDRTLKEEI